LAKLPKIDGIVNKGNIVAPNLSKSAKVEGVVGKSNAVLTNPTVEYAREALNQNLATQNTVNEIMKTLIGHSNAENIWRMQSIAVMRMFSLNILEFRIEKQVYYDQTHNTIFIRTPDSRLFRINVTVTDTLKIEETEYKDENKYYCDMYSDIMQLANSIPKELNGNVIKEAEKVKPLCK